MTNEQAKQILQLYRPGTADAADPDFAEALDLCERDAELKRWFANHCALYTALRAKFKKIRVPEGFKEQIIAERQVHQRAPVWQKAVLLAGAVAALVMVASLIYQMPPRERHDFATYRSYMGALAFRSYYMDFHTNDLDQIRLYLAQRQAIADYIVPDNLKKNAEVIGCVSTTWQGKQVSMICFKTGKPLQPGAESDLWLFIADQKVAKDAPPAGKPAFEMSNGIASASWTVGNRTYVLATPGDQATLQKYLPES